MNKEEFRAEYDAIMARALAVCEKFRRAGLASLEKNIDKEKCEKKDPFEYGLRLAIDGKKPQEIEQILDEIINKEADGEGKLFMTIKKDAIAAIIQGWNTRLVAYLINSHVSIGIEDLLEGNFPGYVSLNEDPRLAEYDIYECAERFREILDLSGDEIRKIMRKLDSQELATAVKHAGKELQDVFTRNMSEEAAEMFYEDMYYMDVVEPQLAQLAQKNVIDKMDELKAGGNND
jgi:hypothetical protein